MTRRAQRLQIVRVVVVAVAVDVVYLLAESAAVPAREQVAPQDAESQQAPALGSCVHGARALPVGGVVASRVVLRLPGLVRLVRGRLDGHHSPFGCMPAMARSLAASVRA